jgi:carbon-monoxide dehydrogenase small subunit
VNKEIIRLQVNGEEREVAVPAHKLLLDVLREDLGLTGSKRGCDDSSCGCPVQEGYAEAGGAQCGFCTPGFMIATKALLDRNPNPGLDEIREALSSNLCRCTGYMQIYESVKYAIEKSPARTTAGAR